MAFVQAVVQAYQQRGLSPASALATAQIAPEAVQHQHARITALQMELLCAHAMRELDDEALGWFSRRLPWGSYGMLARASISAPRSRASVIARVAVSPWVVRCSAMSSASRPWWRHQRARATCSVGELMDARASMP